ncbi:hypothetical protein COO60DRAFT_1503019 [Scenedesmus sp. NREL 46B-D3]|nr:hypothetical protein COO60DRAFT_1503019 [Scenedesmus sp. NREL 46B-D3]
MLVVVHEAIVAAAGALPVAAAAQLRLRCRRQLLDRRVVARCCCWTAVGQGSGRRLRCCCSRLCSALRCTRLSWSC